jgi:hypothetical protein
MRWLSTTTLGRHFGTIAAVKYPVGGAVDRLRRKNFCIHVCIHAVVVLPADSTPKGPKCNSYTPPIPPRITPPGYLEAQEAEVLARDFGFFVRARSIAPSTLGVF